MDRDQGAGTGRTARQGVELVWKWGASMALITSFRFRNDRTISFKTQVECGWTYDRAATGTRLLQLETYASDGTTSQVLQIAKDRAADLLAILHEVFPRLSAIRQSAVADIKQ